VTDIAQLRQRSAATSAAAKPRETAKEARQRRITERLVLVGDCSPQDLVDEFGVSLMTIHRDLDDLERRGIVRKFHGGVTAQPSGVFESQLSYRIMSHAEEKAAIAQHALAYVEPGMSVLLDDSTPGWPSGRRSTSPPRSSPACAGWRRSPRTRT
jgi:DeoR/GlpR family transcriptional regulator of sugar metabolism